MIFELAKQINMITFITSIILLIIGYLTYGKFVDRFFNASSKNITPANRLADNVDFKVLKPWKIFIIQFLNIAGLGPIFGAILGAAYGPVAYIWIVFGCIFMGAVHDYFSGMMSIRNDGKSLPELVGKYLGNPVRILMTIFTVILLLAVGSSFVKGPAGLLQHLTNSKEIIWLSIIFVYYIIATLLPIDKIIGNIYPYFGAFLFFMAIAIFAALIFKGFNGSLNLIELTPATFHNFHADPSNNILVPMLFIVISCGALSGFHATQSPLMARCMSDEKYGRSIFYGAMIAEGIVALIWATAAMAYFGGPDGLNASGLAPAVIVDKICKSWLGISGAVIAILGIVVCPITSGDTAFRSLRLILADSFHINQKPIKNRLVVAIPLFLAALIMCNLEFKVIWNYVGIGNQALACFTLWTGAAYLKSINKSHLMLSIPATFITFICISYFIMAPNIAGGLHLNSSLGYTIGTIAALILFIYFCISHKKENKSTSAK